MSSVTTVQEPKLRNYVNGAWRASTATEFVEVINPATAEVLTSTPLSTRADYWLRPGGAVRRCSPGQARKSCRRARTVASFQRQVGKLHNRHRARQYLERADADKSRGHRSQVSKNERS